MLSFIEHLAQPATVLLDTFIVTLASVLCSKNTAETLCFCLKGGLLHNKFQYIFGKVMFGHLKYFCADSTMQNS